MKNTGPEQQTANNSKKASNYLSEEEAKENRIRFTQRTIATLQNQKNEEKDCSNFSNGRRRWFNQEIEKGRSEMRELIEEADK